MTDPNYFADTYYKRWPENERVTYVQYVKLVQNHKKIKYREAQKIIKEGDLWTKVQWNCAKFIKNNPETKQSMLDCIKHDIMAEKNEKFLQKESQALTKKRSKYIKKIDRFIQKNDDIERDDKPFSNLKYELHLNDPYVKPEWLESNKQNLKKMKKEYKKLLEGTSDKIDKEKLKKFGIVQTDKNYKPKSKKEKTIKIKIKKIEKPKKEKTVKIKIKKPKKTPEPEKVFEPLSNFRIRMVDSTIKKMEELAYEEYENYKEFLEQFEYSKNSKKKAKFANSMNKIKEKVITRVNEELRSHQTDFQYGNKTANSLEDLLNKIHNKFSNLNFE